MVVLDQTRFFVDVEEQESVREGLVFHQGRELLHVRLKIFEFVGHHAVQGDLLHRGIRAGQELLI